MGVSKNNGTPKSSILIGFSIINHPFWGTHIFGNTHIRLLKRKGFGCDSSILVFAQDEVSKFFHPTLEGLTDVVFDGPKRVVFLMCTLIFARCFFGIRRTAWITNLPTDRLKDHLEEAGESP